MLQPGAVQEDVDGVAGGVQLGDQRDEGGPRGEVEGVDGAGGSVGQRPDRGGCGEDGGGAGVADEEDDGSAGTGAGTEVREGTFL